MASTYLSKTFGSAGNRKKFTISTWVKRSGLHSVQQIMACGVYASTQLDQLYFNDTDTLNFDNINTGGTATSTFISSAKFRDTSAWMHIVVKVDSTQVSSGDRVKFYVNGSEISLATETQPSQNFDFAFNNNVLHNIGTRPSQSHYFDGSMTHFHFTDGYAYDASTFGETDSTSGIWKPKTAPSVTYGTNGFFLKFENSGAMGTDSSGNSNTWSVGGGTLTQNVDTPSNVFAVLNRLDRSRRNTNNGGDYLSKGNLTFDTSSTNGMMAVVLGTMGVQSGKYYWEYKVITNTRLSVGISQANVMGFTDPYYDLQTFSTIAMNLNGNIIGRYIGSSSWDDYATGTSNTTNDIIGLALDMDNKALYIHKNGTYLSNGSAVGVPTSGASRTGSLIEPFAGSRDDYIPDGEFIFPYVHDVSTTGVAKAEFNFGQGYFGTTQVASAGTSPSGGGIFEHDCPNGYQALCTKGINSF